MNEHSFIKAVHKKLPPEIFKWKIHDTFTGGVPDAWYCSTAGQMFVEYKYIKELPKRTSTVIKTGLSPLQIEFLDRLWRYKLVVAVIIGSNIGSIVLDKGKWHKKLLNTDFENGLSNDEIAKFITSTLTSTQTNERFAPKKSAYKRPKPT